MKLKDWIIVLLGALALLLLWAFLSERERAKRKDDLIDKLNKENEELKIAYLDLLKKYLQKSSAAPDVIEELERLKNEVDHLETEVHIELNSVIQRVNDGEGTKAVNDLAKIVENKLKEKVKDDESFTKRPMLYNLLEHAFACDWISSRQFENGKKLKDIRNKESHELAPAEEQREIGLTLFAGIDILYAIK